LVKTYENSLKKLLRFTNHYDIMLGHANFGYRKLSLNLLVDMRWCERWPPLKVGNFRGVCPILNRAKLIMLFCYPGALVSRVF